MIYYKFFAIVASINALITLRSNVIAHFFEKLPEIVNATGVKELFESNPINKSIDIIGSQINNVTESVIQEYEHLWGKKFKVDAKLIGDRNTVNQYHNILTYELLRQIEKLNAIKAAGQNLR